MATLSDLDAKRSELNQAIATYTQAVQDLAAGTTTQAEVDTTKATAQARGDELAKLVAQVEKDDPNVTNDDQLFSKPTVMNDLRRADIAKIVRFGKLNTGIDENWAAAGADPDLWITSITGSGTGLSFYDAGTENGSVLRMTANTRYDGAGNKVRLETVDSWPVGTSFKVRVKELGSYGAATYLGLVNDELATRAKYQTDASHSYAGVLLDEDGNGNTGLRFSYNDGETSFIEFELKWVNETTLEWYKNGELIHTSAASFSTDHKFIMEFYATNYGNWVTQALDIDFIKITPP